ncbi:hypothetical protein AGMMS49938_06670 [Fibrobacterales bacterium]|nr:hypothetical protein AGMMS49938_06670 [Fibrobacterales bacterium]
MTQNIVVQETDSEEDAKLGAFFDTYDTTPDIEEAIREGTLVVNPAKNSNRFTTGVTSRRHSGSLIVGAG